MRRLWVLCLSGRNPFEPLVRPNLLWRRTTSEGDSGEMTGSRQRWWRRSDPSDVRTTCSPEVGRREDGFLDPSHSSPTVVLDESEPPPSPYPLQ